MVPFTWIEHVASPLPRECSTTELKGQTSRPMPRKLRNTARPTFETGAGEGNRTLVISLEGFSSTIELHPRGPPNSLSLLKPLKLWWRGLDSNQRTRKRTDLQSVAFNHSATPPRGTPNYIGVNFPCQQIEVVWRILFYNFAKLM